MSDLRDAAVAYQSAQDAVDSAVSALLMRERLASSFLDVHQAIRSLVEALLGVQEATRRLALVLALDPEQICAGVDLDVLVPPLIEGSTVDVH